MATRVTRRRRTGGSLGCRRRVGLSLLRRIDFASRHAGVWHRSHARSAGLRELRILPVESTPSLGVFVLDSSTGSTVMKKFIASILLVNAVLLAGRFWSDLTVAARGVDDPELCRVDPSGLESRHQRRGRGRHLRCVYLLNWLFVGGPEPKVCLAAENPGLTPRQLELLEELDFGSRVAGTWALGRAGRAPGGVITINADGTATSNDANDFSNGGNENPGFQSAVRWSWRRIEGRRVEVVGLFGVFPVNEADPEVVRLHGELEFSPDYETFSGTVCEFDFSLDQDPLDRGALPTDERTYPVFARRVPFLAQVCEE